MRPEPFRIDEILDQPNTYKSHKTITASLLCTVGSPLRRPEPNVTPVQDERALDKLGFSIVASCDKLIVL